MIATKTLKLNLGSRDKTIPGFENMDCEPHTNVKHVGDVSDLSRFDDGSVDEIYASHILEHFSHKRTLNILKEWCRVLKNEGIIYIGVPDFKRIAELYSKYGYQDWIRNLLYGDQDYPTAFHYCCLTESLLTSLLLEAGFSDVSRVETFPFGIDDCSAKVDNFERKPISLNLIGVK